MARVSLKRIVTSSRGTDSFDKPTFISSIASNSKGKVNSNKGGKTIRLKIEAEHIFGGFLSNNSRYKCSLQLE